MSKKKIWVVIILMSIALAGVIIVQIYWIESSIQVRHEQFERSVNEAMNCVVSKLETQEAFSVIDQQSSFNNVDSQDPLTRFHNMLPNIFDSLVFQGLDINDTGLNIDSKNFAKEPKSDTVFHFHDSSFYKGAHNHVKKMFRSINDSVQYYMKRSMNLVNSKMNKLSEVMQKMALEFLQKDENITKRIDPEMLDKLISSELKTHKVTANFNYGIMNAKDNKLLVAKDEKDKDMLLHSQYKAQLFPNDIFMRPDYLVLYFPGSKTWVLRKLWSELLLSIMFTLIIIIVFAYTIMIIFRQKKLSDIKTDFINNMTHEFKTPIATISLAADSINNPKVYEDTEKVQYYAGIIKEENKRMNLQVEQVLKMALLDKGEFKLNIQDVDVHELISSAVEKINLQVEQRNGYISEELEASNHTIKADPVHISNIIFNLLDNANKYSPEHPEITIKTRNTEKGIIISVSDKGIGMTKETQKKIFEKFYRVPTGNLHDVKGFGLGLSYVKVLVNAHEGNITLKSEQGMGSSFEIFLPYE